MTKIAVIGFGAWGKTLMNILVVNPSNSLTAVTKTKVTNESFKTNKQLNDRGTFLTWSEVDLTQMDLIIVAVNSKDLSDTYLNLREKLYKDKLNIKVEAQSTSDKPRILVATKGMPENGCKFAYEIFQDLKLEIGVLSGPNLAAEFLNHRSIAVVAFEECAVANEVCAYFPEERLKCQPSTDLLGLQLSSSLKNILAIGAGILGKSDNELGILVQHGLAEAFYIGKALGINIETIIGPAFLGDLVATSSSHASRNHKAGNYFLKGNNSKEVVKKMHRIGYPEGIPSAFGLLNRLEKDGLMKEMIKNCPVIISLCEIVRAGNKIDVDNGIQQFKGNLFSTRTVHYVKFY